ncbi:hypothetical protein Rhopal_002100-T1 [Rhodotorula paludigena]|uniref:protein-L-isoaspartate(D-aspartate) O-methyltransferase n=1 Tax=Rhodotorula paludigena TaxID=86838 RepID=A0AAV5GI22_9BASI|nr:hypothetical protein Rhopal_002100-T1 [Rhodotorula paludigena]
MAWSCSGKSNAELVDNLLRAGILSTPRVVQAFKRVDRKYYVSDPSDSYRDSPSYIGAIENLEPFLKPNANVLDVGSGSGYLLGLFHSLVQPGGTVLGIDHIPELVALSRANLSRDPTTASALCADERSPVDPSVPESKTMQCILADGRQGAPEGFVPSGGWQAIHVGAAAPHLPQKLVDQLASPGRMFIPVGVQDQSIYQIDKDEQGNVTKKRLYGVRYVPLTDREAQFPQGGSP